METSVLLGKASRPTRIDQKMGNLFSRDPTAYRTANGFLRARKRGHTRLNRYWLKRGFSADGDVAGEYA